MPDPIGGPGSRPAGLTSIPTAARDATNVSAPTEVEGQVTNRGWAPGGAGSAPAANPSGRTEKQQAAFEKATKEPSWLGLAGNVASAGLRSMIGSMKKVPILGNVLNLVDASMDAGKLVGMYAMGKGTPQERLKVAADLAAHTVGIFNKEVGADYDKGQASMRLHIAGAEALSKVTGIDIPPELRQWFPVMSAGYGGLRGFMPRNPDGSERELPIGPKGILAIAAGGAFLLPRLQNMLSANNNPNPNPGGI